MAAADAEIEAEFAREQAAKQREYREANREKIAAKHREYIEKNRDKWNAYQREYRRRKKLDQRAED